MLEFFGIAPGVDLTFQYGSDGDPSQLRDRAVPLLVNSELEAGTWVYWSGQNTGSGDLTCRIPVDGAVFKETTSPGTTSSPPAQAGPRDALARRFAVDLGDAGSSGPMISASPSTVAHRQPARATIVARGRRSAQREEQSPAMLGAAVAEYDVADIDSLT
ncbi:hypothetical protein [Actinopolymorpha pittospori]|uniref:Uncharacterized protein n=1 Tax=Actinopolymorpha pittospori TaxID=648752 RepID=A0A927N0E1_9ACTN|nr:hypothetical protein [Actinopolymorpha pittospori]MBE1608618.1 hypothetical protein [Actinopolymorpha pittospori]